MNEQITKNAVINFLETKKKTGETYLKIIQELRSTYGPNSIDPSTFVACLGVAFGITNYTPLEFAEMAKVYYGNANDVAKCIKLGYTSYTAEEVGKLLLQPTIYPDLTIDDMTAALVYAGFSQSEARTAVKELYCETTVGYVLMLDSSASMDTAIGQVKIDAKAFISLSKYNDQFGINQFSDNATWVYPSNSNIVTVDKDLTVLNAAAEAIEQKVVSTGMTNMGGAISLGNEMIKQSTAHTKSFIMLSDGYSNVGTDPVNVLGNEPPLFVAGLGRILKESYFTKLLAKNPKSKFYWSPSAIEMMEIFNDIRAIPNDVAVTANQTNAYNGSNFQIIESDISSESEQAQFSVVWTNERCQYTSGNPSGYNINVILYDPTGKRTSYKPAITGPGYCVFNVNGVQPGTWKTLIQYSLPEKLYGTSCGFEFNTLISLDIEAPNLHKVGNQLPFTAKLMENGKPIENAIVQAKITSPHISVENAIIKYKNQLNLVKPHEGLLMNGASEDVAKLHTLWENNMSSHDILATTNSYHILKQNNDGHFEGVITPNEAGAYNIEVSAKGINSLTNKPFSRVKQFSVLVG